MKPKKSSLPDIASEHDRDDAIRDLSPSHGYSISEVAYMLNVCRRTIERYIINGTFRATYRGNHPLVSGDQVKQFYFAT